MTYKLVNLYKESLLLDNVEIADSFFSRLRGLLGRTELKEGQGLIIKPCNSIHTFGMKFPIDVAFVDQNNKVIKIMENTAKAKVSPIVKNSKYVIEARSGEFQAKNLQVGDLVEVKQY